MKLVFNLQGRDDLEAILGTSAIKKENFLLWNFLIWKSCSTIRKVYYFITGRQEWLTHWWLLRFYEIGWDDWTLQRLDLQDVFYKVKTTVTTDGSLW